MRLVLVCGALEPGRDGVGDYCRTLAHELRRRGHPTALLALHDPFVEAIEVDDQVMRLPPTMSWSDRAHQAADFVRRADPDTVSLQFVPWAFHSRGLGRDLPKALSIVGRGLPWHVMFHELWLPPGTGWRHTVLGRMQRPLVKGILDSLSPHVVHTSIDGYVAMIASIGSTALKLPIFGNIPFGSAPQKPPPPSSELRVACFGSPPDAELLDELVTGISAASTESQDRLAVQVGGGNDGARADFVARLAVAMPGTAVAQDLGRLAGADVDMLLMRAHVGVSRMEGALMGKSGVTVAMLERGLPVWGPRLSQSPVDVPFRAELVFRDLVDAVAAPRLSVHPLVPWVAQTMLDDLAGLARATPPTGP